MLASRGLPSGHPAVRSGTTEIAHAAVFAFVKLVDRASELRRGRRSGPSSFPAPSQGSGRSFPFWLIETRTFVVFVVDPHFVLTV